MAKTPAPSPSRETNRRLVKCAMSRPRDPVSVAPHSIALTSREHALAQAVGGSVLLPIHPDQSSHNAPQPPDHPSHSLEIDLVRCVVGRVIVRIPKIGRVRDHKGRIPLLPERPVVGEADVGDGLGQYPALGGKCLASPKRRHHLAHEPAVTSVANKGDEIAGRWVEAANRRWVLLAAGLVAVVADGFEAQHPRHLLVPLPTSAGGDPPSPLFRVGGRGLLLFESHQTEGSVSPR